MTAPPDAPSIPALPWYRSRVMVAFLTILVSQLVAHAAVKYKFDLGVYGITVADIVDWAMDAISAGAIAIGLHSRSTQPQAPITTSQAKADAINTGVLPK